ncbi:hypothetical protein H7271_10660 [Bittarella massiliensis]|uniref:hypothetical protein n=1 Tax=Bittarella massiliensis (ex Durand et al. 2017) TaxID=1720313 RepID=UPI00163C05FB|nr:hypothetical protein [Bittarella massiliensis (ex Durand et al. 2017)]MBC2872054.1 hypothetical protein [Bittarella massiliensis (ex Durand et al. 2017)]
MKKLIGTALVFVLCLALTGCGNKDEKAIQEVVNGYFAAFQAGDLSGAKAFCDDDLSDHTTMILSGEVMEGFVTDQFGDVFRSEAEQFGKDTIAKFVKEYKLDSLSIEKGNAVATLTVKMLDLGQLPMDNTGLVQELGNQYTEDHMYELIAVMQSQGEAAMKKKLYDGMAPLIFQKMSESVDKIKAVDYTFEVKLEKQGDRWVITQLSR